MHVVLDMSDFSHDSLRGMRVLMMNMGDTMSMSTMVRAMNDPCAVHVARPVRDSVA